MGTDAVTSTLPTVPTTALWARVLFLLTRVGGVSRPAPGADGLAVAARRRSGVVLGRTGASSDRELGRAETVRREKLHPRAPALTDCGRPTSLGWTRGRAEREHLRGDGDGESWLCRNSVLSSARSPGPVELPPSSRHACSNCCVVGCRVAAPGASSCTGSGAPRRLGSCRDSVYSSEKLLAGERGGVRQEHPVPGVPHLQPHSRLCPRLTSRRRALQTP